jgi:hypothetical protein
MTARPVGAPFVALSAGAIWLLAVKVASSAKLRQRHRAIRLAEGHGIAAPSGVTD